MTSNMNRRTPRQGVEIITDDRWGGNILIKKHGEFIALREEDVDAIAKIAE